MKFVRLAAERNVRAEKETDETRPNPDGLNITNLVRIVYQSQSLDQKQVTVELLERFPVSLNLAVGFPRIA